MKREYVLGYIQNVFLIDISYLKSLGIKYLVCDLDQTLASAFDKSPDQRVLTLRDDLKEAGIQMIIISNNFHKRVSPFCDQVKVPYLSFAFKFAGFRVRGWLKKNHIDVNDCVFVGDQLMTDGIYVKRIRGRLILTDPLVKKDNIQTIFLRKMDYHKRDVMLKKNKLGIEIPKKEEVR
ncbi:MAG: hypothetical protein WCR67_02440 [Bacilli bacterium]